MSEDYKNELSKGKSAKVTNDVFPPQQGTLQNEKTEIADLKSQLHELRELMEMQKDIQATRDTNHNDTSYQEDTGLVTFRDIQKARNIYSVPEKSNRTKSQMYHYLSSNDSPEMGKQQPTTYRQPLEVNYVKKEVVKQNKKNSEPAEEPQQPFDDSPIKSEQKIVEQNKQQTNPPSEQTISLKTEEVKSPSSPPAPNNEQHETKASPISDHSKPVQQTELESLNQSNQSSPITHPVDTNDKKSMFEYIFGKIKTPT